MTSDYRVANLNLLFLYLYLFAWHFARVAGGPKASHAATLIGSPSNLIRVEERNTRAPHLGKRWGWFGTSAESDPSSKNPLEGTSAFKGHSPRQVLQALPANMQTALLMTSRRIGLGGSLSAPMQCPALALTDKVARATQYYSGRSCAAAKGMWADPTAAPVLKYKFETIAAVLGLRQGHRVLDWGAGCGHQIDLIAGEYAFDAYGIDLLDSNTNWALNNLKHLSGFCTANGSTIPFPDESLDAVVSNGAVGPSMSSDAQCKVMHEVLRVLRPGGCAWFGWMGRGPPDTYVPDKYWTNNDMCLKERERVTVATVKERTLFGVSEYDHAETYSLLFCKPETIP